MLLVPAALRAQASDTTNPATEVRTAVGTARPIAAQTQHYTAAAARDWTLRLRTRMGQCYEVLGLAVGTSRVTADVNARNTRAADTVLISTSNERVARGAFCVTLPGNVYSVRVHADGATNWSLSVVPSSGPLNVGLPGTGTTAPAPDAGTATSLTVGGGRIADAGAPALPPAPVYPVGGTENDYVALQLRAFVSAHPGARAVNAVDRGVLQTNQSRELTLSLNGAQCVDVVAAGMPSVSDVDIEITDPGGNRVAQDAGHRGVESVRFCPSYTGRYRVAVRIFQGLGLTAVQAFSSR